MEGVARKQNNGRIAVLAYGVDYFPMNIVDDETTAHQKKIDRVVDCTNQQVHKSVLPDLIRVEQDGY